MVKWWRKRCRTVGGAGGRAVGFGRLERLHSAFALRHDLILRDGVKSTRRGQHDSDWEQLLDWYRGPDLKTPPTESLRRLARGSLGEHLASVN